MNAGRICPQLPHGSRFWSVTVESPQTQIVCAASLRTTFGSPTGTSRPLAKTLSESSRPHPSSFFMYGPGTRAVNVKSLNSPAFNSMRSDARRRPMNLTKLTVGLFLSPSRSVTS